MLQHFVNLLRQLFECRDVCTELLLREFAELLADVQRQKINDRKLRAVCFCGRDGNFRACPRIQHVVRFGCNGAADNVHDGEHTTARTLRFAQRRQRIGGLAGLADDDHERVFVEDRVAVTELRCNIHFDRDAQQFFKRVLCHDAHVVRRATCHDVDFCEAAQLLGGQGDVIKHDVPVADTRCNGITHGFRLLEDLLHHEMLKAALFGRFNIPLDVLDLFFDRLAVCVIELHAVAGELCNFVIF